MFLSLFPDTHISWTLMAAHSLTCWKSVCWYPVGLHFGSPVIWRHNGCDGVSNHQPHDCLLNCLFRRRSKETSKLRVTGLCAGNSPGTGEFPAQMASNAENVSIWWRHHANSRPFYYHDPTIIPVWLSNHTPSKVWDEIIYSFPNFNGRTTNITHFKICGAFFIISTAFIYYITPIYPTTNG